jgi:hypothetical protein
MEPEEGYGGYTDEELDLYGEFSDRLVRGERPVVEDYLDRLKNGSKERLRRMCENDVWFYGLVQEFKRECPGRSIWDLLGVKRSWERYRRIQGGRPT